MANPEQSAYRQLLPLKPLVFQILLILIDGERHGWSIVKELQAKADDGKRVLPGNLYRTLNRMRADGLIEETGRRPDGEADEQRRRYFRVSDYGLQVTRAEADRYEALVVLARSKERLKPTTARA